MKIQIIPGFGIIRSMSPMSDPSGSDIDFENKIRKNPRIHPSYHFCDFPSKI